MSFRGPENPFVIHPFAHNALGPLFVACGQTITVGTVAWPAANRALFIPFSLSKTRTLNVAFIVVGANGSAAANFDIGLYDVNGIQLYHSGSVAQSTTANAVQVLSSTVATILDPGRYYMALNCDTSATTAEVQSNGMNSESLKSGGMLQQDVGAIALPAVATFARLGSTGFLPFFGFAERTTF